jgi:hypothetical protein
MRTRRFTLTWLGALSLLASCALLGHKSKDEPEEPRKPTQITLHVENQNFYDATIYAMASGGERQRLGNVTGNSQATFTFRWLHDELRVVIQLLAGRSGVTQTIPTNPGDTLNLVIQPDFHFKIPD